MDTTNKFKVADFSVEEATRAQEYASLGTLSPYAQISSDSMEGYSFMHLTRPVVVVVAFCKDKLY